MEENPWLGDYEGGLMSAISENPNRANYYIDYGMALIDKEDMMKQLVSLTKLLWIKRF